jgi:hypothetical protein
MFGDPYLKRNNICIENLFFQLTEELIPVTIFVDKIACILILKFPLSLALFVTKIS